MFNYKLRRLFIFSIFITCCNSVFASENLLQGADEEYGEYLSGECVTCHQQQGSDKGIPSITGWDMEAFAEVMIAYKEKELENPVMQTVAGRLDKEQIASLALFFGKLPPAE